MVLNKTMARGLTRVHNRMVFSISFFPSLIKAYWVRLRPRWRQ